MYYDTTNMYMYMYIGNTIMQLQLNIKGGSNRNNLSTKDMLKVPNVHFSILLIYLKSTLQRTKWLLLIHVCPLFKMLYLLCN